MSKKIPKYYANQGGMSIQDLKKENLKLFEINKALEKKIAWHEVDANTQIRKRKTLTDKVEELKVIIEHEHKCECIAKAPSMGDSRSWWVGKLIEKIPEHPEETHCLHLKTQFKDVTYLCNIGDFQQLQVLCMCVTEKLSNSWIDSMIKISKKHCQEAG